MLCPPTSLRYHSSHVSDQDAWWAYVSGVEVVVLDEEVVMGVAAIIGAIQLDVDLISVTLYAEYVRDQGTSDDVAIAE